MSFASEQGMTLCLACVVITLSVALVAWTDISGTREAKDKRSHSLTSRRQRMPGARWPDKVRGIDTVPCRYTYHSGFSEKFLIHDCVSKDLSCQAYLKGNCYNQDGLLRHAIKINAFKDGDGGE